MNKELELIIETIKQAGDIILKYNEGNELHIKYKIDKFDPVTQADLEAELHIIKIIRKEFSGDKILSEETENKLTDFSGRVWMIDPLDGTKDFVGKGERFSVMIGLCVNGIPELGVVFSPISGDLYFARKGEGAYFLNEKKGQKSRKIQVSEISKISEATYFSKSKYSEKRVINEKIEETLKFKNILNGGSLGVVLGEIALGKGECYILTNKRACKWDSCAPQVILEEAGGMVTDVFGDKVDYLTKTKQLDNLLVATNGVIHEDVVNKVKNIFSLK